LTRVKIGCFISSSGSLEKMARQAFELGGNTFQFFSRNPRGGNSPRPLTQVEISGFVSFSAEHGFAPLCAHAPYTLNACGEKEDVRDFARRAFSEDLARMEQIPGHFYNFHPGCHVGQGTEKGVSLICALLDEVMEKTTNTTILLETMAGKGSEVGGRFEELRMIADGAKYGDRLGVCFDTCHVYDAGYDIKDDLDGVLAEFDRTVGLDRLRAVHLNDSKNPPGSRKDRHEKIGQGTLGTEFFERFVNHPLLRDLTFYLETPNEPEGYAEEIALLKGMYKSNGGHL